MWIHIYIYNVSSLTNYSNVDENFVFNFFLQHSHLANFHVQDGLSVFGPPSSLRGGPNGGGYDGWGLATTSL